MEELPAYFSEEDKRLLQIYHEKGYEAALHSPGGGALGAVLDLYECWKLEQQPKEHTWTRDEDKMFLYFSDKVLSAHLGIALSVVSRRRRKLWGPFSSNRRYSKQWHNIRRQILDRDKHRCQVCGRADQLHVHHIIPALDGGLDTPDNLITLCARCHPKKEGEVYGNTRG